MLSHLIVTICLFIGVLPVLGQNQSNTDGVKDHLESLDLIFSQYHLRKQNIRTSKSNEQSIELKLELAPAESVKLKLFPVRLLSHDHVVTLASGDRLNSEQLGVAYTGNVIGKSGSNVRLFLGEDFIYGYIDVDHQKYFIEPASTFDESLEKDISIIYKANSIKKQSPVECAASHFGYRKKQLQKLQHTSSSNSCSIVELAIAVDHGYQLNHDSPTGAINQTVAIMNMVAGDYSHPFDNEIRFEIVEHFISDCSTCDPWTTSRDANSLLDDFTSWGGNGFTKTHDIGQLWTSRDICGSGNCSVAGLAWIDEVCSSFRYHILEDFTSTAWQLRVLTSHEIGHNFGSDHDSGLDHIMAPSITTNTTTWSAQSINTINSSLSEFSCFEECEIGSCTEIIDIYTSDCVQGATSTYNLNLTIRHGGGGSASSFDVILDGQSYNFLWTSSPQEVSISGLIASGAENRLVEIRASDNSDAGCAGSENFDEPSSSCSISYFEDFNECEIPDGWTRSSTNDFLWNGGDPLVQYEWKFDDATRQFGNYDDHGNSGSLKTLDGTCMALMDDDIINHSLYTGEVTLTSPEYDLSQFDSVFIQFDYNFHPFEDGGKGNNNSYFRVEIFDGFDWQVILNDQDSECPWHNVWPTNCSTFYKNNITAFANAALRVRFLYSDGNDGRWTGMVALDNFEIHGKMVLPEQPCEEMVQLNGSNISGTYEADQSISIVGPTQLTGSTIFSASVFEISAELEIPNGIECAVDSIGCDR